MDDLNDLTFSGIDPTLAAQWRSLFDDKVDSGPEFLTRAQLQALWGVSVSGAKGRLASLRAAGKLDEGYRRVTDPSGKPRWVSAYRLRG